MNIGKQLKTYRQSKHLTQETLADMAGVNEKYYGCIERNENCPTVEKLIQICKALDIDIIEIFLYEIINNQKYSFFNQKVTSIIVNGIKNNIDIHFNRDILRDGCQNSLWYNGFIGSMNFEEFELQLYAVGNIKGKLFIDFEEVLEFNEKDIFIELQKYIKNDSELYEIIEYMSVDEKILKEKDGNALFIIESNWLSAKLLDNQKEKVINSEIILDDDNILSVFKNTKLFIDYIFE